jgi:outer membrane protein TolC
VEIRNARERLAAAADVLASTRDQVVPGAHQALATITDAYRMGRSSYQEIADAQRALLEAESAALNARAEVWRAQASLARLAGVPLTETTDGGGK